MKLKTALLTSAMTITAFSGASYADESPAFKVAVVDTSSSSTDVISGKYAKAIATLRSNPKVKESFEESTSLCVAYIKSGDASGSISACNAAIDNIASLKTKSSKVRYLHSLSYSNRAVARYFENDMAGAMDDLKSARLLNNNNIVKTNLTIVKKQYMPFEETSSSMSAE